MSDRITGISSMATRQLLAELGAAHERRTGRQVSIRSVGGVEAARLVRAGEPFDLVLLASDAMEALEGEGWIVPGSRTGFARSGIAMAIRQGAPRPAVGDAEAVRQAVLAAPRIGFSTGPSGSYLKALWERWGIGEAIADRLVQAPPGVPVGTLLARGEVELGFQQLSELLGLPGIDVIGPLPAPIQSMTLFSSGIGRASRQPDAVRALVAALNAPEAAAVKRRHGMEPG
ncbi:substrate-binding domain-containing protein [Roseomonas sp. NAR14]|uniref:Substrate-binding domain-containing protein n=1 Tax=Roseomonas acroporae TaxID=2937791 RepID=A0A9X1Y8V5_9PROT|nr:substrate-binding domain-containing protein [Roseomonas acroporae]MCK8786274.1 substrate-binding domain-containing protein [Roseomonas acroporae]